MRELGTRLRAIRSERGLALSAVAEATGISSSFLSLVETGKNDITFGRLRRLVDFYELTLADLLPPPDDPIVVRAGEHRHLRFPSEGVDVFLIVPGVENDPLYAALAVYEPESEIEESPQFEGMVLIVVLEGSIRIAIAGAPEVTLGVGDSAYFNAARERHIRTGLDAGARILFVAAPPPSDVRFG
jgi:transcriptional regulator with XRE-family HTH domain